MYAHVITEATSNTILNPIDILSLPVPKPLHNQNRGTHMEHIFYTPS